MRVLERVNVQLVSEERDLACTSDGEGLSSLRFVTETQKARGRKTRDLEILVTVPIYGLV